MRPEGIHPAAADRLERLGILDRYAPADALTAPIVATTLGEKVAALTRFSGITHGQEWTLVEEPALGPAWVIRWDRIVMAVGEEAELAYVDTIRGHIDGARRHLRNKVLDTVRELGLPMGPHTMPALRLVR